MKVNPEIGYWKCPICERDVFKSIRDRIKHMDIHNAKDPEVDISVVAEREKFIERMF